MKDLNGDSEDTGPIAFFCRVKPQGADILSICQNHSRMFIGWPRLRKDVPETAGWRSKIVDPTCPSEEWARLLDGEEYRRQYSLNRNFIRYVNPGSIVVIPRPKQGAVYVARITDRFEIVDSPPWG
ncbi:MAG: hypothetical protein F4X39_08430, partial [Acidobacteriia bacterium]|nr:hypothetical protein [Terriglobia bacterium]